MLKLSRMVIIESDNPGLEEIHRTVDVEHDIVEMHDNDFFDMTMKYAYFITSRQLDDVPSDEAIQQTS